MADSLRKLALLIALLPSLSLFSGRCSACKERRRSGKNTACNFHLYSLYRCSTFGSEHRGQFWGFDLILEVRGPLTCFIQLTYVRGMVMMNLLTFYEHHRSTGTTQNMLVNLMEAFLLEFKYYTRQTNNKQTNKKTPPHHHHHHHHHYIHSTFQTTEKLWYQPISLSKWTWDIHHLYCLYVKGRREVAANPIIQSYTLVRPGHVTNPSQG